MVGLTKHMSYQSKVEETCRELLRVRRWPRSRVLSWSPVPLQGPVCAVVHLDTVSLVGPLYTGRVPFYQ